MVPNGLIVDEWGAMEDGRGDGASKKSQDRHSDLGKSISDPSFTVLSLK